MAYPTSRTRLETKKTSFLRLGPIGPESSYDSPPPFGTDDSIPRFRPEVQNDQLFSELAKLYPVAYNYGMGKISDHELARLAYVSKTISELQAEEKELKARVRDEFSEGEYVRKTDAGTILVTVAASTKLDPKFIDSHPADEYPWLYRAVPDTTAVQKATGKKFYVPDTPRVTVKLVDSV